MTAKVTVLAEGTQGHLTGVAMDRFSLAGDNPQVWALGVKEVWKVPKPSTASSTRWAGRARGHQYREFGGSFIYPMGDDMVTVGMVVGLDYRDSEVSPHDLLQQLKTHPLVERSSPAASGSAGVRRPSPKVVSSPCLSACTRPAC